MCEIELMHPNASCWFSAICAMLAGTMKDAVGNGVPSHPITWNKTLHDKLVTDTHVGVEGKQRDRDNPQQGAVIGRRY